MIAYRQLAGTKIGDIMEHDKQQSKQSTIHKADEGKSSGEARISFADNMDIVMMQRAIENPNLLTSQTAHLINRVHGNQFLNQLVQRTQNISNCSGCRI